MSDEPVQPTKKQNVPPNKDERDALIFTPISIARAKHANSAVERTRSAGGDTPPAKPAPPPPPDKSLPFSGGTNGCVMLVLFGLVFVAGSILGGVVGGGLLLWASNSNGVALAAETPTTTPQPTPTVAPAETPPPTATPTPVNTPDPADIIERVIPSVVTVINQQHNSVSDQDEGRVVGSGVIIDPRGYIATNNHVVDHPGIIKITLADGRETPAELVAANPAEDLAILKVPYTDLPAIEWGNSRAVRPGQVVYAIGSPLGDFPNSVSFGIVSGLNRALEIDKFVIDGLIQTDAAINRGSSGGPLITPDGKVIGINTFIIRESEERGVAEGIAFSIPAETAKNLLIPWIAAHTGESVPIPAANDSQ